MKLGLIFARPQKDRTFSPFDLCVQPRSSSKSKLFTHGKATPALTLASYWQYKTKLSEGIIISMNAYNRKARLHKNSVRHTIEGKR